MRQTELMIMQDAISFASYDRWVGQNKDIEHNTSCPLYEYVKEMCHDNGYEPCGGDMNELEGELLFLIEQYSKLLYNFYTHVGPRSIAEADVAHIMATMHEDLAHEVTCF